MFIQDFELIERPYEEVIGALGDKPEELFSYALNTARGTGERLRTRVGPRWWPAALAKAVQVKVGRPRQLGDSTLVAFSWQAEGASSLFPSLDADLEISPFGPAATIVTLKARYEPPGGSLGEQIDRILLHRVAESTLRAFLQAICSGLAKNIVSRDSRAAARSA
jgi:hypothetical protein